LADWKRRWFVLRDGHLFYYRSSKDLEGELVANVLISTVKVANCEWRNCFEIISPTRRVYRVQAESTKEMHEWVETIQNCIEHMLSNHQKQSRRSSMMAGVFGIAHPASGDNEGKTGDAAASGSRLPTVSFFSFFFFFFFQITNLDGFAGSFVAVTKYKPVFF
jgi:hypothetical protein